MVQSQQAGSLGGVTTDKLEVKMDLLLSQGVVDLVKL
jgi:hypothetical protein